MQFCRTNHEQKFLRTCLTTLMSNTFWYPNGCNNEWWGAEFILRFSKVLAGWAASALSPSPSHTSSARGARVQATKTHPNTGDLFMNHTSLRGAIVMSMAALLGACSSTPPQPSAPSTFQRLRSGGDDCCAWPPTAATPAGSNLGRRNGHAGGHLTRTTRSRRTASSSTSMTTRSGPRTGSPETMAATFWRHGQQARQTRRACRRTGQQGSTTALGQRPRRVGAKSLQMLEPHQPDGGHQLGREKPRAPGHDESAWSPELAGRHPESPRHEDRKEGQPAPYSVLFKSIIRLASS